MSVCPPISLAMALCCRRCYPCSGVLIYSCVVLIRRYPHDYNWAAVNKNGPQCEIFKIGLLAQSSSLGLVDEAQSENIGEKQEYMT